MEFPGLIKPSLARPKLATVDASVIRRKFGELEEGERAAFSIGLREALDLK